MNVSSKSNTVLITTVFPEVEPYLARYLDSLEAQSSSSFELLIANDGYIGLEEILSKRKLQWRILEVNKTISENRRDLINKAIEYGYSKIIFSDSDDELSFNRVKVLSSMLDNNDVVVNDLDIIDSSNQLIEKKYFSNRFDDGENINIRKVQSGNMMGLTNTAATASALKNCIALKKGESIAFDWYLWSTVLLNFKTVVFTNKTTTKYRTHSNNVAGLPQAINDRNVCKGLEVKCEYYKLMSQIDCSYIDLANTFSITFEEQDSLTIAKYITAMKRKEIRYPLWWEQITSLTEDNIV